MPCLLFIIILVVFLWLLIQVSQFGKRLLPLAAFKQMENGKPIAIISLSQPIIIKPTTGITTIRPNQRQTVVIKPASVILIQPKAVDVITVRPPELVTVTPPQRGAWDERGWTRTVGGRREIYEGFFTVGTRQFRGRIETRNRGRNVEAYIYDPPREIKRHRHGACFQLVSDNWFYLHWSRPARNVDDAILYMERVLDESLNG
jgi:hypothetical protein